MNNIYPYYLPGAIPILFIIIIGVPILFYRLITTATRLVGQVPESPGANGNQDLIWRGQMQRSRNICRGLYYGYKYRWRHYTLVLTVQKMLVIAVFVFAIYLPSVTLVCMQTKAHV